MQSQADEEEQQHVNGEEDQDTGDGKAPKAAAQGRRGSQRHGSGNGSFIGHNVGLSVIGLFECQSGNVSVVLDTERAKRRAETYGSGSNQRVDQAQTVR
jgi:hypothetical protein